jgi:argininosuccinate lyase
MPQKRNPDVVELLRGRARELRSLRGLHAELAGGLPGSYHRDHQLLKAPAVAFVRSLDAALDISARVVGALQFQRERAAAAVDDTLYATHVAYRRVAEGESFRDAYRAVAAQVLAGTLTVDRDALSASHTGSARDLGLAAIAAEAETLMAGFRARAARIDAATTSVFDFEPPFDLPGTP